MLGHSRQVDEGFRLHQQGGCREAFNLVSFLNLLEENYQFKISHEFGNSIMNLDISIQIHAKIGLIVEKETMQWSKEKIYSKLYAIHKQDRSKVRIC